jgi:hypothetical protein
VVEAMYAAVLRRGTNMSTELYLSLQIPAPIREFLAGVGVWSLAVLSLAFLAV